MKYQQELLLSTLIFALSTGFQAEAAVPNGGFESGDFTSWNQTGNNIGSLADYQVIRRLGSVRPTEGRFMAKVQGIHSLTDFNFFWSDAFDWSAFTEVCFDIRVLFNGTVGLFHGAAFEAIGMAPTYGQPILASASISGATYSIVNYISGAQTFEIPVLSGDDTGFERMTEWETFCFDPAQIGFVNGDPNAPLSLALLFGWSGGGFADVAFLIDNVVGKTPDTSPAPVDPPGAPQEPGRPDDPGPRFPRPEPPR